jgi:hypothetical protein
MNNLTIQSTPIQPTKQQYPPGYLGFEYPLILGLGVGLLIGSLRNKPSEQTLSLPSVKNEQRVSSNGSVPVEFQNSNIDSISPSNAYPLTTAQTDEYAWINQVLKLPFRVLSGNQGSGKSTLERFMISRLKADGWHVICINPETNPSVWHGVEVLSKPEDITQFFTDFLEWIRNRQSEARKLGIDEDDYLDSVAKQRKGRDGKVAIFLMETNTYEPHGVDAQMWADFLKQCLTNIRKWGFTACFTAHSDNQTSVASKLSGFSKLLDAMPRIDCIATTDKVTNEATSTGYAMLKMKGIKDDGVKVKLQNHPKTKDFRSESEQEVAKSNEQIVSEMIKNGASTARIVSKIFGYEPKDGERFFYCLSQIRKSAGLRELGTSEIKILEIISASMNEVCSFESIRKSRKWGEGSVIREEVRTAIALLIQEELITGNETEGYRLANIN